VIVHFVDIGGIVDHHSLNFVFIIVLKNTKYIAYILDNESWELVCPNIFVWISTNPWAWNQPCDHQIHFPVKINKLFIMKDLKIFRICICLVSTGVWIRQVKFT